MSSRLPSTSDVAADPFAQARQFLTKVSPWHNADAETAYIDIIWSAQRQGYDKPTWAGRAVSSVQEAVSWIDWASKLPDTLGVYVCMSSQRLCEERTSPNGKPYKKAIRNQQNAVALKSFYIDLDAKGADKNSYDTKRAALAALTDFIKVTGLPNPSAIVDSGGGFHVHWTVSEALSPERWLPIAYALAEATKKHGLLCDTQCTIDSARILRVPNTKNKKYGTAVPVVLLGAKDFDYSLERIESALAPYKMAVPLAARPRAILEDEFVGSPSKLFAGVDIEDLGAGIEGDRAPINLDDAARECAFIGDAIATGGATYNNALWGYTTLISTFTAGGRADAHRMANKHPGYTQASTDDLFDRKVRDKEAKNLGWVSCSAISGSGCKACQACPHFAVGKSPLNFARSGLPPKVTAPIDPTSFPDPWEEFFGPPFPEDILPPPLARFVEAEHRAMGVDAAALAMACLTTVAGAIHAGTRVCMGSGWDERPLLWLALLGSPSFMKTPVISKTTAPLRKIDNDNHLRWQALHDIWKTQSKSAGANAGPAPRKAARQIIQDATPEKIAELLARDTAGSLMVIDELAGLIASFDRYGSGPAARSFYLSCWNGGPHLKDRVGKGANDENAEIRVDNLALCILGGIQPDRLAQIKDLTSDGLLQRYLFVSMRAPVRGDDSHSVVAAEVEYAKLIQNVQKALPLAVTFTAEAAKVRSGVADRLFRLEQVQGFSDALVGAIGKMRGYYGRLALTLHLANEHSAAIADPSHVIDTNIPQSTAEDAEKLLFKFLLPHAFGVYDAIAGGGKDRDTIRAIAGFILASDKDRLRQSDITSGVRKLRGQSQKEIAEWASRFCAMGWLRPENDDAPVPKAWVVVPGLHERFAQRRKLVQQARAEAHAIMAAGGARR